LRFDNMPSGWSDSSTERFPGWDIIPTQVPYRLSKSIIIVFSILNQQFLLVNNYEYLSNLFNY